MEFMQVATPEFLFGLPIYDIVDAIHVKSEVTVGLAPAMRRPPAVRPALKPPWSTSFPQTSACRTGGRSRVRMMAPPDTQMCRPTFKPKLQKEITNFRCAVDGCSYVAQSPRHMVRHSTTHTGERRFPCRFPGCEYRAKQREHLRTHQLIHSDLKPFECPLCEFATKRKEHLTRHLKRHGSCGLRSLREQ